MRHIPSDNCCVCTESIKERARVCGTASIRRCVCVPSHVCVSAHVSSTWCARPDDARSQPHTHALRCTNTRETRRVDDAAAPSVCRQTCTTGCVRARTLCVYVRAAGVMSTPVYAMPLPLPRAGGRVPCLREPVVSSVHVRSWTRVETVRSCTTERERESDTITRYSAPSVCVLPRARNP